MALVIAKSSSYDVYDRLRADVFEILDGIGGAGAIAPGAKVLIKPNLLAASSVSQAITTHPMVIRAAVEFVLSRGALPTVADSPPMASFQKLVEKCGIVEALAGLEVNVMMLTASREVSVEGRWKRLDLSSDALDADVIINLPKLKSHAQMDLTLAVKNMFGCVIGMKKPEWHFRIGENREIFAELLVTIYGALRPRLNLIDGILAMEGDGPGAGGTPRRLGVLLGSESAVALDMAVCRMLGIEPYSLLTNAKARELGLAEEPEISGALPEVRNFVIPSTKEMLMGPHFARGFFRRHIASRPVSIETMCRLCNECLKMCPAGAISIERAGRGSSGRKRLAFDYDKCIRCYCCLEICPHRAMRKHDTLLKRAMRRVFQRGC